jgi:hypothetical protein
MEKTFEDSPNSKKGGGGVLMVGRLVEGVGNRTTTSMLVVNWYKATGSTVASKELRHSLSHMGKFTNYRCFIKSEIKYLDQSFLISN